MILTTPPRPSGAGLRGVSLKPSSCYVVLSVLALAPLASSQNAAQQTPAVVGSTVTGHVFCDDTQAPARFARIMLKSTTPNHAGSDLMKSMTDTIAKAMAKSGEPQKPQTETQKRTLAAASRNMDLVTDMLGATTVGLDGAYSFAGVKPGTYYVHVIFPGYLDTFSQFTDDDFASPDPAVRARIGQIPTVTVSGTDSARADVRMERGAAVSGRLLYDDGTPATGWTLTAVKPTSLDDPADAVAATMAPALAMGGFAQLSKTDDRGNYRISGLAAGEYVLRASLDATPVGINNNNTGDGGSGIKLVAYSGDTFTRAQARTFKLIAGDERVGVDIIVPARHLHNILGRVVSRADGHTLNVGQVNLTVKDNPAVTLMAAVRDDGSFRFEYLPEGVTYTLTLEDAADGSTTNTSKFLGMSMPDTKILHKYDSATADVLLGGADVDSVLFTVAQTSWTPAPDKPGAANSNPADLLKGVLGGLVDSTSSTTDAPK